MIIIFDHHQYPQYMQQFINPLAALGTSETENLQEISGIMQAFLRTLASEIFSRNTHLALNHSKKGRQTKTES